MEPWGRIGSGVAELIAALLLLMPRTVFAGALLTIGVISGAISFHLTKLGVVVTAVDDHGEIFDAGCGCVHLFGRTAGDAPAPGAVAAGRCRRAHPLS